MVLTKLIFSSFISQLAIVKVWPYILLSCHVNGHRFKIQKYKLGSLQIYQKFADFHTTAQHKRLFTKWVAPACNFITSNLSCHLAVLIMIFKRTRYNVVQASSRRVTARYDCIMQNFCDLITSNRIKTQLSCQQREKHHAITSLLGGHTKWRPFTGSQGFSSHPQC